MSDDRESKNLLEPPSRRATRGSSEGVAAFRRPASGDWRSTAGQNLQTRNDFSSRGGRGAFHNRRQPQVDSFRGRSNSSYGARRQNDVPAPFITLLKNLQQEEANAVIIFHLNRRTQFVLHKFCLSSSQYSEPFFVILNCLTYLASQALK